MSQTEVTVQVFDDLNTIDNILKNSGFLMIEKFTLNDYYFSKFNTCDLKKMDYLEILNNSILIRKMTTDKSYNFIIYKNKKLDNFGNVIAEDKIKTCVDNFENTIKIFNSSNLNNWCTLNNISYVYKKDEIELLIQVVDDLGIFIEFEEYKSIQYLSSIQKFEQLCNYLKTLNLKLGNDFSCKKPYMKLIS